MTSWILELSNYFGFRFKRLLSYRFGACFLLVIPLMHRGLSNDGVVVAFLIFSWFSKGYVGEPRLGRGTATVRACIDP